MIIREQENSWKHGFQELPLLPYIGITVSFCSGMIYVPTE